MSATRSFGTMPDGRPVPEVRLEAAGIRVAVIGYGAAIRDLEVETPSGWTRVVLGYETLDPYLDDSPYFGAIVGRCANRIAQGRFDLDGRTVQVDTNDGPNQLHGGPEGFDKKLWVLESADGESATFALVSPNGDQGYPGTVTARCRYRIGPGTLAISLAATTDAPTLVNLAGHSYFNLSGGPDSVFDHILTIHGDRVTAVGDGLIPTGVLVPVDGTTFDFRKPRRIGDGRSAAYDHNYVLAEGRLPEPRPVAQLEHPGTGIVLTLSSTEPGLQFYDGNMLKTEASPTLLGRPAGLHDGLCLEPQLFPDAIHHPGWASPILRPGDVYRQETVYSFSTR